MLERPLVMLIDDEKDNIVSLKYTLQKENYRIIECYGGHEALEIIERMDNPNDIHVIVCDQRMPKMTGVEFFENIKEVIPEAIRIILTGYTDTKAIVDSINKANIYKFISKPVEPDVFKLTIARAVELHKLKVDLREGDKLKKEFISAISHELITPLNGIQGGVDLLDLEMCMDDFENNKVIIRNSVNQIRKLIDSIISFTVFESGGSILQPDVIALNEAVSEICSDYLKLFEEKGISFNINYLKEEHCLYLDFNKVGKLLDYLLSNALKFTELGKVNLDFSLSTVNRQSYLKLELADTGIGIQEEKINEIFELFRQLDGGMSREYGGIGIGLTLAKRIVSLLDGDIEVESEVGKGSKFTVNIPVVKMFSQQCQINKHLKSNTREVVKALVVEDNVVNQRILKAILEQYECQVKICKNGREAVETCLAEKFDVIFMDCQMPVMNGFDATKEIRSSCVKNSQTLIVAVTANVSDSDRRHCAEVGMNMFLSKPIDKEVIQNVVRKFI